MNPLRFVPADGSAFVAAPKGFARGCVCCGLMNTQHDVKTGLCRDCWRAWRFSPSVVVLFDYDEGKLP